MNATELAIEKQKLEDSIDLSIAKHGYTVLRVESEGEPDFTYTIGFSNFTGFELIITAKLRQETQVALISTYIDRLLQGEPVTEVLINTDYCVRGTEVYLRTIAVEVKPSPLEAEYITITRNEHFRVYQILVADKNNLLPGESGYDTEFVQPLFERPLWN